jgi:transaldolase
MGLDELLQLAGVAALTIVPDDLQALRSSHRSEGEASSLSLFTKKAITNEKLVYPSYIDDEAKYRVDFDAADGGRAQLKLGQVGKISQHQGTMTNHDLGNYHFLRLSNKG